MKVIVAILSWAIGLLFIYAGMIKVISPADLYQDIMAYRVVGHHSAWLGAVYLPWIEIFAGTAILIRKWRRAGAIICLGLMLVFTMAVISAWWRGLDLSCGCFGRAVEFNSYAHILMRDVVFLAVLVIILCCSFQHKDEPCRQWPVSCSGPKPVAKRPRSLEG